MARIGLNGVSVSEVANALRTSAKDIGVLCTHPNINKWSKHKPIRFQKVTGLTENDFRGQASDVNQGIVYGLKATVNSLQIDKIHASSYDYVGRPAGGEFEPFRLGDFCGYDPDAKCNLNATVHDFEFDPTRSSSLNVTLLFDELNTTGVNIDEFVSFIIEGGVGKYYPCVVVKDYMHALKNSDTNTYTQFKVNGAWQRYFKVVIDNTFPYKTVGEYVFSICLVEKIQTPEGTDFRNWVKVKDHAFTMGNIIAVPDCTGLTLRVIEPASRFALKFKEIRNVTRTSFAVVTDCSGMSLNEAYSYTVHVVMEQGGSMISKTYPVTKAAGQIVIVEDLHTLNWLQDFGLAPLGGERIKLKITISDGNGITSDPSFADITIP